MSQSPLNKQPEINESENRPVRPHLTIHHTSTQDYSQFEPASAILRVAAFVIDMFVLNIIQTIFRFLLRGFYLTLMAHSFTLWLGVSLLVSLTLVVYYSVWPLSEWGQTLGKKIVGIKVVNTVGPNPAVGFSQAMKRELVGKFVSGMLLLYGYLRVLRRADRLALHDTMAGTRVIKV